MNSYIRESAMGRMLILFLEKGDLVLENIHEQSAKYGISDGVILSGIGSLRKLEYHAIKSLGNTPEDEFFTIEAPLELGSLQGLLIDGKAHLHTVCSALDRTTYAGHLEPGSEVQYLVEISILEIKDANLTRRFNENGINCIISK